MARSVRAVRTVRLIAVGLLLVAMSVIAPVPQSSVQALSPDIVISQIYGGGGNSGTTYTNDFVELYNRGASAVPMTNWSVQYQGSTGTTWSAVTISGTINPGQYFLIQLGGGTGGTTALPPPDASASSPNLSATAGKVA